MKRSHIVSLSLFLVTFGILLVATAVRYGWLDRDKTVFVDHHGSSGENLVLRDVNWDRLPEIEPFRATERAGGEFESKDLDGKVWIASFFFTACPSVCREQNNQLAILQDAYADADITFVSITCDPENDTPVVLREYAKTFNADEAKWLFITGDFENLKQVSETSFQTALTTTTHGTNFMLIDKWGRFRDRFDWQQADELVRLRAVVDQVLQEEAPPQGKTFETRSPEKSAGMPPYAMSLQRPGWNEDGTPVDNVWPHGPWQESDWIKSFTLTERSGETFSTEEMQGQVWVGSFFFCSCPSICKKQNAVVADLVSKLGDREVTYVSITSDPVNDTPLRLRQYADSYSADRDRWLFLTGERLHIRRIASEYFYRGFRELNDHATELMVVDKWGNIRGYYDWEDSEALMEMRISLDELLTETEPPEDLETNSSH